MTFIAFIQTIHNLFFYCTSAKLKAWEEQQACWESQRADLEQRAEDGEEKADKLEKYDAIHSYVLSLFVTIFL